MRAAATLLILHHLLPERGTVHIYLYLKGWKRTKLTETVLDDFEVLLSFSSATFPNNESFFPVDSGIPLILVSNWELSLWAKRDEPLIQSAAGSGPMPGHQLTEYCPLSSSDTLTDSKPGRIIGVFCFTRLKTGLFKRTNDFNSEALLLLTLLDAVKVQQRTSQWRCGW